MIRSFRATAVAALAFVSIAAAAAPAAAQSGSIFDHGAVNTGVSPLGLNDAAPLARPVAPAAAQPAAPLAPAQQASVGAFQHMVGLATATPPATPSLDADVARLSAVETQGAEEDCLANAVYFEARGESLEGQLAVAEVVMNRARSGRYPTTWCGVVVQRAQFSFVRAGIIPAADRDSQAWRRAVAIARIAQAGTTRMLAPNVLWYHANYVSPAWGRRLARSSVIGAHIFYR
ncbi:MAG TPA: cell wall hydrolase [Allosphingosinicella sp.]|nr:cell wall hydrolase [Allosphingosinicella sp.]